MNIATYIEVLDANLWPVTGRYFDGEQWYFQDDNASIHRPTGSEGMTFHLFFWPPQSPDLNPD